MLQGSGRSGSRSPSCSRSLRAPAADAASARPHRPAAAPEPPTSARRRRSTPALDGLNAIGLETFEPLGAFYVFPRIASTCLDDETFTERLLTDEREALRRIGRFVEGVRG